MASLNLVPNPPVLAVQAAIFLTGLVVVKKLFVEPYLTVRDKREKLTLGSKDEAQKLLAECDRISQDITAKLNQAVADAKQARDKVREAALAKRQTALSAAEGDSKKLVAEVENQIKQDLAAEKAKVPAIVKSLTDEVYKLALA
jgi:F0F1-type ATP synthase membrane subunit b/b'